MKNLTIERGLIPPIIDLDTTICVSIYRDRSVYQEIFLPKHFTKSEFDTGVWRVKKLKNKL